MNPMKSNQRGVAMIELALALPFLLVMTFIATEFGRAIYQYDTLAKSVRDAARYLSAQTPGDSNAITAGKNLVVYGNTAGTGNPLALGLTTANVPNPTWQLSGTLPVINTVTVQVTNYSFQSLMGSAFGLPFGTVNFSPIQATMRSQL
jgi:Flp pilus assembly protein TadG